MLCPVEALLLSSCGVMFVKHLAVPDPTQSHYLDCGSLESESADRLYGRISFKTAATGLRLPGGRSTDRSGKSESFSQTLQTVIRSAAGLPSWRGTNC